MTKLTPTNLKHNLVPSPKSSIETYPSSKFKADDSLTMKNMRALHSAGNEKYLKGTPEAKIQ